MMEGPGFQLPNSCTILSINLAQQILKKHFPRLNSYQLSISPIPCMLEDPFPNILSVQCGHHKLLSLLLTIPSAHARAIAVFTTSPFSRREIKQVLTCLSNSSPQRYGWPLFFSGSSVMSPSLPLFFLISEVQTFLQVLTLLSFHYGYFSM